MNVQSSDVETLHGAIRSYYFCSENPFRVLISSGLSIKRIESKNLKIKMKDDEL